MTFSIRNCHRNQMIRWIRVVRIVHSSEGFSKLPLTLTRWDPLQSVNQLLHHPYMSVYLRSITRFRMLTLPVLLHRPLNVLPLHLKWYTLMNHSMILKKKNLKNQLFKILLGQVFLTNDEKEKTPNDTKFAPYSVYNKSATSISSVNTNPTVSI